MATLHLLVPVLVLVVLTGVHAESYEAEDCTTDEECVAKLLNNKAKLNVTCHKTGNNKEGHCECSGADNDWFFDNRVAKDKGSCFRKTGKSCNQGTGHYCDKFSVCACQGAITPGCRKICKCRGDSKRRANDMGCHVVNAYPVACDGTSGQCDITNSLPGIRKPICEDKKCTCASLRPEIFFDNRLGPSDYRCYMKTGENCTRPDMCDQQSSCTNGMCACKKGFVTRKANMGCGKPSGGENLQTSMMLVVAMFLVNKMA